MGRSQISKLWSTDMPRIGDYNLHSIDAGRFFLDGGAMFGIIPKPLWERKISADGKNRIPLRARCLLLESADRLVLIDNGIGDKYDDKFASIYGIDGDRNVVSALKESGFSTDDVTDVILTHLHFDHCGGSTRRTASGVEPVFSSAVHHVQQRHWDWAWTPNQRESGSFFRENYGPLQDAGLVRFVNGVERILPGISVMPVDGHTEAQQLVGVASDEATLLFLADLVPTHAHVPLVWGMGYDLRPLTTIEEKQDILGEAADGKWTVFFEHDDTVEIASIVRDEKSGFSVKDVRPLAEL
jgi:glyoxylase-like metal-dependent hydrolase (beta-lactamase superfamily II)